MDSPSSRSPGSSESPTANPRKPLNHRASSLSKSITDSSSQSFSSILNNPNPSSSVVGWWSSSTSVPALEFSPLPSAPKSGSELSRSDFAPYLSSVSESHSRFVEILKQHDRDDQGVDGNLTPTAAGEALVACLREVPAPYFKEDFELEDGATFKTACPFRTTSENIALQERLSQYLDVVELHLVREISLRSSSFFEAQEQLEDLNAKIVEGCRRVRELKETIRLLSSDLVGSARRIQELSMKRGDSIALQNKLRLVLSVNQALSTIQLLVASADCVGALDIIDDLQHLLDGDELIGLHCFRHLRDHVAASINSVNSILSAEFVRASLRGSDNDLSVSTSTFSADGRDDEVRLMEEQTSHFQDQLLPLVIGLLRTGKLPAVLRIYCDTLASDIKTSVKILVENRPLESDTVSGEGMVDADGGGSSLGSKLKSLSPESFLKLLEEILKIVQTRLLRASEVKRAIEWIMGNLDGHYAAASVAVAIAHGAAAPEAALDSDGHVSSFLPHYSQIDTRVSPIHGRGNDSTSPNLSKNFRADILRENAEALFAACDAAHGRWAKIIGIRSQIHPKLRLQDFLGVYNISQEFISSTEKIGGRLGYSIRGTLQSQAKSFIEFQHESRMGKMRALLDQENWAEIDVPDEFQTIVTLFSFEEPLSSGDNGVAPGDLSSSNALVSSHDGASTVDVGPSNSSPRIEQPNSNGTYLDQMPNTDSSRLSGASNSDVSTSTHGNSTSIKERGKSSLRMLYFKGVGYHMVNCGLYLVKMMSEYIDMNNCLPILSAEVVHRVAEILKFFNSRTAHLVLGANALQVSGLKSITARHLAMASQVISFTYAIIPEIRRILLLKVPETYKALLQLEIDRVATDYKNHRDEIHSKLVQIMRERLLLHLRSMPQIVEGWNRSVNIELQPSQFARSLTKEIGQLLRTLSKHLLEEDVQAIFEQVVGILHFQIFDAFSHLEISTPQAKSRLHYDIQHILGCIRSLPSYNLSKSDPPNLGLLDEFLEQHSGSESGE